MEFEFDKEIDALLRKARAGGNQAATVTAAHLDADELSAFAENALPDTARKHYTAHLAECTRCRKILSNLISLNSEAGTQSAFSTFPAGVAAAPVPWYRRLFAFPQVAYAMGALVLLFSGFMAYIVLQSTGSSELSIAKKEADGERPRGTGGINSDGASVPTFTANSANTAANMSNSATASNIAMANSNTIVTTSAGSTTTSNTNSTANAAAPAVRQTPPAEANETAKNEPKPTLAENYAAVPQATPPPPPAANVMATAPKDDADAKRSAQVRDKEKAEDKQRTETGDIISQPQPTRSAPSKKVAKPRADATRSVGGKTFRRVDSAWVDSEYQQGANQQGNLMLPPLRYVRRGSDEYKKLDGGLKDIAEKLDGIVIVLWKNKGYRIQ